MRRIFLCMVFCFLLLDSGCTVSTNSDHTINQQIVITATQTSELPTPEPIAITPSHTPTLSFTPTLAHTPTPTMDSTAISLYLFDFFYAQSSLFEFDLHYTSGEYYGTGRLENGSLLSYACTFREEGSSRLVCTGGDVPYGTQVFFQLFSREDDVLLYSNTFINNVLTHGEKLYTPTGVSCVVEPVVSGLTHNETTGIRCFIMTCRQNEAFLWGTLNTCTDPWPFEWEYYHPLHTPGT